MKEENNEEKAEEKKEEKAEEKKEDKNEEKTEEKNNDKNNASIVSMTSHTMTTSTDQSGERLQSGWNTLPSSATVFL